MKNYLQYIISDTARSYQSLQVFRLGSVLLLSVVLVQLNIGSEYIGDFEWFIFLANVASFFWALGLKNAFMSFFPNLNSEDKNHLIINISVLFLVLGSLVFTILYFIDLPRMDLLYSYLPWLFCFLVLGTTASLTEHVLIVTQQSRTLFFYGLISYSVYFFGLSLIALFYKSIQPLFIGIGMWACLRFIYFLWLIRIHRNFTIKPKLLLRFILFGLPLVIHVLLGGGMEYVDGYIVEAFFERSDFTYFRYGARELPINTIFISAMASAFIPLAVADLNDSLAQVKQRTSKLMNYLFPISMVLMLSSPMIYQFVYNSEYLISAQIFNIYLLIICSRILLPQIVIYAKHKNSFLMAISFVEFTINIGLSLFLMQDYGLQGIAFATVIAFFIQKLILIVYNSSVLKIPLKSYIDVPKYLLFSLALYATFVVSVFFYD